MSPGRARGTEPPADPRDKRAQPDSIVDRADMKQVADRAGVAMSSVSRVLSGHPNVSETMRNGASSPPSQELGYEPNMLAQHAAPRGHPDRWGSWSATSPTRCWPRSPSAPRWHAAGGRLRAAADQLAQRGPAMDATQHQAPAAAPGRRAAAVTVTDETSKESDRGLLARVRRIAVCPRRPRAHPRRAGHQRPAVRPCTAGISERRSSELVSGSATSRIALVAGLSPRPADPRADQRRSRRPIGGATPACVCTGPVTVRVLTEVHGAAATRKSCVLGRPSARPPSSPAATRSSSASCGALQASSAALDIPRRHLAGHLRRGAAGRSSSPRRSPRSAGTRTRWVVSAAGHDARPASVGQRPSTVTELPTAVRHSAGSCSQAATALHDTTLAGAARERHRPASRRLTADSTTLGRPARRRCSGACARSGCFEDVVQDWFTRADRPRQHPPVPRPGGRRRRRHLLLCAQGDTTTCTYRGHGTVHRPGRTAGPVVRRDPGQGRTGSAHGKGGSMHLTDLSIGALGSFAIVGAHLPISVGAAWAAQLLGTGAVSVRPSSATGQPTSARSTRR